MRHCPSPCRLHSFSIVHRAPRVVSSPAYPPWLLVHRFRPRHRRENPFHPTRLIPPQFLLDSAQTASSSTLIARDIVARNRFCTKRNRRGNVGREAATRRETPIPEGSTFRRRLGDFNQVTEDRAPLRSSRGPWPSMMIPMCFLTACGVLAWA